MNIKHRLRVILITLSFLLPFALATWFYEHSGSFQFKTTNLGHLFTKPTAVTGPWTAEKGRWQVLYWPGEGTTVDAAAAQKLLYQLHQMRIALGRNKNQLTLSVILAKECSNTPLCQQRQSIQKSDIVILSASSEDFIRQLAPADAAHLGNSAAGKVYLIDPQGYFFMVYEENEDPLNILQDLKHIWEVSSSG